jgi:CRISPR/Cas system CMR-associated protein Cmr5 small subunit
VYFGDLFDLLNDTESKTFPETFHKFRRILAMRYLSTDSAEYLNLQRSPNHFNPELVKGVSFGGLDVVMNYMQVFREKDSVVVTKETEKIMQATLKAVRNRKLMEFADFD